MSVNLAITNFILNFVLFLGVFRGYSGRGEKLADGGQGSAHDNSSKEKASN